MILASTPTGTAVWLVMGLVAPTKVYTSSQHKKGWMMVERGRGGRLTSSSLFDLFADYETARLAWAERLQQAKETEVFP